MPHSIYRFGDCTLDAAARELHRGGTLVTLSPKVFDCLAYLIEHRERAVGRDELISAVWGKTDVSDTLVGQTVLKARRALGRSGGGQNAIRTIPRFGYRWVGEIVVEERAVAPGDAYAPVGPSKESAPRRRRSRGVAIVAAGALALVITIAVLLDNERHTPPVAAAVTSSSTSARVSSGEVAPSAVVLPVAVDAGPEWAWVRLGLMDLVAGRLRSAGQAVVPSDNVVALARANGDAQDRIRDATGARFVVVPRARRDEDGWAVGVALTDADGSTREAEAHDADVIAAGRLASDRLLAMLGLGAPDSALGDSESRILQRAEAAMLSEDLDEARHLLEDAPPAVRDSPEARIRLAHIALRAGHFADARAQLAKLLDDLAPEAEPVLRARALVILGSVGIRTDRFDDGRRAFAEAVSLIENRREPGVLGQAYTGRGVTLAAQGHYDAALADFSRARIALELAGDGLALARVEANEGLLEATLNRPADAVPIMRRAERRFERFGAINERVTLIAGEIDAELDLLDPAAALAASERAWPLVGRLQSARIQHALKLARARALAASGRLTEARALLDELIGEADPAIETLPIARARAEIARLDFADGQTATAAALAASAIADLTGADDVRTRGATWLLRLRALRAAHQDDDAARETAALRAWADASKSATARLYATLGTAEQAWAERRRDAAQAAYADALHQAGVGAAPTDLAEVVVSYGGTLVADGELEQAGAVIGQVARWSDRDFACALLELRFYQALEQKDAWRHALVQAKALAGERGIPRRLLEFPSRVSGKS